MAFTGQWTLWFLILLLAILPRFPAGTGGFDMKNMDPAAGVYDSDYRGPQTHTYVPPPHKAHHRQQVVVLPRMSKGSRLGNSARARAHHHVNEVPG